MSSLSFLFLESLVFQSLELFLGEDALWLDLRDICLDDVGIVLSDDLLYRGGIIVDLRSSLLLLLLGLVLLAVVGILLEGHLGLGSGT